MTTAIAHRTDADIQADVLSGLKWDARVKATEVGVSVKNGVVSLSGWVDSYVKRTAAEEVANRTHGVKAVANDLEVKLPSSSERTDGDIAEQAARAIEWDAFVPSGVINIAVTKGIVTLKGNVETLYQKQDAERVVRRLTGVRNINNWVAVKPSPAPSELKHKIEQALVRDAETEARRISVNVQGRKVTLTGMVQSWAEKQAAEQAVWSAPGIESVSNQITIS